MARHRAQQFVNVIVSAQATVGAGPYLEEVEALRKYKIDLETESILLYEVKRITIITGQLSRD